MRMATALVLVMVAGSARAGPAGPPAPAASKTSAAQDAMAVYARNYGPRPPVLPCRQPTGGEVVVCGQPNGASTDRLPLPDERAPPDHARIALGEPPSAGAGGAPVGHSGMVGVDVIKLAQAIGLIPGSDGGAVAPAPK